MKHRKIERKSEALLLSNEQGDDDLLMIKEEGKRMRVARAFE